MLKGYDTAQVCQNGHIVNSFAQTRPEHNQKFCSECGSQTITACPHCQYRILGYYHLPHVLALANRTPPAFCRECGKPYPWTEKKLAAARDLANELEKLDTAEREALSKSFDDLVRNTPSTPVAVSRFRKLVAKAGSVASEGLKTILVDIVSEAVKKQLWP